MADNVTLPRVGGTFISRMKEVASGIFSAVPLIGDPATGDPLSKGRKDAADTLSFSLDNESKAVLDDLRTAMEALAAIIPGLGAKATADPLEPSEGTANLPLSTNLFQALRVIFTDDATGEAIDTSLASGVYADLPAPLTPYLPMANNTNEQNILAAAGVGVFHDLYGLIVTNTSGSDVVVEIRDDTGASSPRMVFKVKAGEMKGFVDANSIMKQTADNDNWTAKMPSGAQAGVHVTAWFRTRTA